MVVTSGINSFRALNALKTTPMNRRMIRGSVGKLIFMVLTRSSIRCTDRGVAQAKKYSVNLGLVMVNHSNANTAGAASRTNKSKYTAAKQQIKNNPARAYKRFMSSDSPTTS
tara:strand:- start:3206 stop:3541 length:336 start_codon:yes stop_codon:yes gene_type:complete